MRQHEDVLGFLDGQRFELFEEIDDLLLRETALLGKVGDGSGLGHGFCHAVILRLRVEVERYGHCGRQRSSGTRPDCNPAPGPRKQKLHW
jgi:hypothetical protein